MRRAAILVVGLAVLSGCGPRNDVTAFAGRTPEFHLEQFYSGHSRGYGFFFLRNGSAKKQFVADENGSWDGSTLKLHEHYVFEDGKVQDRDWVYAKNADGTWIGRTPEVVGVTTGREDGNAYRMHYTFNLAQSGSDTTLDFDDWSWMVAPKVMMNRAWGTKLGIDVGDIQAVFLHD